MITIPYSCQTIDQDDIDAVSKALLNPLITQGEIVPKFERRLSEIVTSKFAVAASSATAALIIAYKSLGIGPGKIVWTVPNSFVATANAVLHCGATVDFIDINPTNWNISIEALKQKLLHARSIGQLPSLVVPVHFAGLSSDMESIAALGKEFGFKIVEDAAHALGASYNGRPVGCSIWSDATVFSFHPVKSLTTGEGGAAVTNNAELARKMEVLRSHGITREHSELQKKDVGDWYYEQQELGWHFRLTDFQAALGLSQVEKLTSFIEKRRQIAVRYIEALSNLGLMIQTVDEKSASAWHLFVVNLLKWSSQRKAIFDKMRSSGIGVHVHYIPIYLQPYYQQLGFKVGLCPNAEKYYEGALSLPIYPTLLESEQLYIIKTLKSLLNQ